MTLAQNLVPSCAHTSRRDQCEIHCHKEARKRSERWADLVEKEKRETGALAAGDFVFDGALRISGQAKSIGSSQLTAHSTQSAQCVPAPLQR